MGRIRSIKPEFPQSESIGRLSRDARLLFLQLFTLVDDEGRSRGSSRMLASLLYPYDPDAPMLIGGWLDELETEGHVRRYTVEGQSYLEVVNFVIHQKIDRPSKSKLPPFEKPREDSSRTREDSLGIKEGIKDQGRDQGEDRARSVSSPVPDSVDTRILCETVGIFNMREQVEMGHCFAAFVKSASLSVEKAMEHMVARWNEYLAEAPTHSWQHSSAYKFFMSGKWDDPRSWPREKTSESRQVVGRALTEREVANRAAREEHNEREAYAMWVGMSEKFKQENPWQGQVPA